MATSNLLGVSPQSLISGAAIGINRCVKLSAVNTGIVTTAITETPIGIALISAAGAGELVPLQTVGIAKCVAAEAITIGTEVMCTSSGAGKVSIAAGATAKSIGVAMSASGADGDTIEILLALPGVKGPANA